MAEFSNFSEVTDNQGGAFDMARPGYESSEEGTTTMEKPPHAQPSEFSPANTASGLDQEDRDDDKSHPMPPTSASTSFYKLRNQKMSKLVYDAKYHPMDDAIRPTQAAKRRSAHGEEQFCLDADDSSAVLTDAEESKDEHSDFEDEPKQSARGKKRRLTQSRSAMVEPTRRSSRNVSNPKVSYDMSVHPQDEFLVVSSDEELVPKKKLKNSKHEQPVQQLDFNHGAEASGSGKREYADFVANSTDDQMEFDDESVWSSLDAGTEAPAAIGSSLSSLVAGGLQVGIQNLEIMGIDSMSPEMKRFHHDEAAWPCSPGQPFSIFTESLSDQLARDARAASPLDYEDDDKENETNTHTDSDTLPPIYGSFTIMPEADWRESSEERELSSHRALVSQALYDDPPLQTYGLDGSDSNSQVETDEFFETMKNFALNVLLPL